MFVSTLLRTTTVKPDDFEKRKAALLAKLLPYLQRQPGFAGHDLQADGGPGGMVETIRWETEADCRRYLRGGAAAMAATWLDGFFPTTPYPDGTWIREVAETIR